MSNMKEVHINAEVRYDLGERGTPARKELYSVLDTFLTPTCGMRLQWGMGPARYEPAGDHGGKLAVYAMSITGQDGVSVIWIQRLLDAIWAVGGKVQYVKCFDLDNGQFAIYEQYNPTPEYEVYPGAREYLKGLMEQ
jgi:hypothetical protein